MSWRYRNREGEPIGREEYVELEGDPTYRVVCTDTIDVPGVGEVEIVTRWHGVMVYAYDALFVTKIFGDESLHGAGEADEFDAMDEQSALENHTSAVRRYTLITERHEEAERLHSAVSEGYL